MVCNAVYTNSIKFPASPVSFYYNALSYLADSVKNEKDKYIHNKNVNDNENRQLTEY